MSARDVVLCSPVRTAIGAYNGSLKGVPAADLGATVVRETLKRSGLDPVAVGSVVLAFGLAALITGNLDDSWITSTRRWVIISWYFLSQGLILGSLWAYEELGWGGYWG